MKNWANESVGILVAERPHRAVVFDDYGIDFCCGGKQTLETACERLGLEVEDVIARLAEDDQYAISSAGEESWLMAGLSSLADHIEETHHNYLKIELPRLQALAEKVLGAHGEKDLRLEQVLAVFQALRQELEPHMMKEEKILFPYIRRLEGAQSLSKMPFGTVANPVRCMEAEHEDAAQALRKLRELTDYFQPPSEACASWIALLDGLARLDRDLRIHVHKENTILFPRAIEAENSLLSAADACRH